MVLIYQFEICKSFWEYSIQHIFKFSNLQILTFPVLALYSLNVTFAEKIYDSVFTG